jgi:CHAT domain-containing protein
MAVILQPDGSLACLPAWMLAESAAQHRICRSPTIFNCISAVSACRNRCALSFSDAISLGDGTVDLEGRRISVAEAGERLAWLLLPRLWELPHGTDLTIIPAPMLEGLPFAALQVRGEPVIATLLDRLNYAPSLRTLEQLQRRIAPAAAGPGLFIGAEAPPPGFSPLVKAAEDAVYFVKELRAAGRDGEVLTDGLTEADIRDRVPGHDILQIYLHGMLDPNNPMNSHFILPSGDPISSFDIFRWHLQGAQLLLTACEIGGDVSTEAGDILGMTFPFFVAGARSATHALWRVDQQVASWLMQHIVAAMADGNDASASLVKAQRALIDSDLPLMRKQPRHWAAWRVVGPAP